METQGNTFVNGPWLRTRGLEDPTGKTTEEDWLVSWLTEGDPLQRWWRCAHSLDLSGLHTPYFYGKCCAWLPGGRRCSWTYWSAPGETRAHWGVRASTVFLLPCSCPKEKCRFIPLSHHGPEEKCTLRSLICIVITWFGRRYHEYLLWKSTKERAMESGREAVFSEISGGFSLDPRLIHHQNYTASSPHSLW